MKIRNIGRRKIYDVYAIAVYTHGDWSLRDRAVFYVAEDGMYGLAAEPFSEIEIVDPFLGLDFKFHTMARNQGFMLLWSYFKDIDHLSRIIDLNPDAVKAFEEARNIRNLR